MIHTPQETWCFIKEKTVNSHGPGTVIGQDGKQILVKHGSNYVRVNTCRMKRAINSDQNEIHRTNHDYRKALAIMKSNQVS